MKVYLAGNFPQMIKKGEEKRMSVFALSRSDSYKRLISFYYQEEIKSVLRLKTGEKDES